MVFLEWGGTGLSFTAHKVKFVAWAYEYQVGSDRVCLSRRGGGHSGTEEGRTRVTYFAEEGVFLKDLRMSAI